MKITVIVSDGAVYKDGISYASLDLSSCNIPQNVRVLQFDSQKAKGWLEFAENEDGTVRQNEVLDTLPTWAGAALSLWDAANNQNTI